MKKQITHSFHNEYWKRKAKGLVIGVIISVFVLANIFMVEASTLVAEQNFTVNGMVTDENEESLPGVSIVLKGTLHGTITDAEGFYQIEAPSSDAVLIFTFVGMQTQEITIGNRTTINVQLLTDIRSLTEVVVTALGIKKEVRALGYARQSVDTESLTTARDGSLTNMLAGKAAGVNVISGGSPTGSTRIEIRGNTSITGNNQPLFVIDGIPIINEMGQQGDLDYGNAASNINPDDVESIEILKGANAAALYGSDAANGVVLITTKKGKKGDGLGVTFSQNVMMGVIREYPEFQNVHGGGSSFQFRIATRDFNHPNMVALSSYDVRSWGLPMTGFDVLGRNGEIKSYSPQPNNVYDYFGNSLSSTTNIAISKAHNDGSFRLSYTLTDFTDVLENFNERGRHAVSFYGGHNLSQKINVEASARYTLDNLNNRSYGGWSNRNPLRAYLFFPRDFSLSELTPWKDDAGNALRYSSAGDFLNPNWALHESWNEDVNNWFLGDISLNVNIVEGADFRLRVSSDEQSVKGFDFNNKGATYSADGDYSSFSGTTKNIQYEGLFTFNKKIDRFSLNGNLGANWRDYSSYRYRASTQKLIVHDVASLSNSAEAITANESLAQIRRQSILGAATVGYNDLLYLDITGRNDWNSTLPIENCSYFYPSASMSFIFSEALNIPESVLLFGKLRASWAKVGNGTSFNQLHNAYIYDGIFNSIPIFTLDSRRKNPNLRPESTVSKEIGLDLRFRDNRIGIDATYYNSSSTDQIIFAKIPTSTGFSEMVYNAGEVQNKGVEISVNAVPIQLSNLKWDMTLNWSKNNNKVISLLEGVPSLVIGNWGSGLKIYAEEGQPYGVLRGADPLYDDDGVMMIQENGRPYTGADVYIGNVQPDFMGSLINTIKFKRFDLSFMFDFKKGGSFFSASAYHGVREGSSLTSLQYRDEYILSLILGESGNERLGINQETGKPYADSDRVKGGFFPGIVYRQDSETGTYVAVGPNTNYISTQTYWQTASGMQGRFIYDASFVKLRELVVGYSFPASVFNIHQIKSAKLSLVGRNLWTIFKNTPQGIDPQSTASTGNDQGLEAGFSLPTAYFGADFKISF